MAFRSNYLIIKSHVIIPVSQMRLIIIHHIAQKTLKKIEATVVGQVGRFESQMPFPDHDRFVIGRFHHLGQGNYRWQKVSPAICFVGTDNARNSDLVWITTAHQRGA